MKVSILFLFASIVISSCCKLETCSIEGFIIKYPSENALKTILDSTYITYYKTDSVQKKSTKKLNFKNNSYNGNEYELLNIVDSIHNGMYTYNDYTRGIYELEKYTFIISNKNHFNYKIENMILGHRSTSRCSTISECIDIVAYSLNGEKTNGKYLEIKP